MPVLLLIFILVPLAEIAVFIEVGKAIGVGWTIGIVIVTAIAGASLLRAQGFAALERTQKTLSEGRIPVDTVIDGVSLLTAGAFLLTPGMITDTMGFLLFIPAFRHGLAKWLFKRMARNANINVDIFSSTTQSTGTRTGPTPGQHPDMDATRSGSRDAKRDKGPVIEAEYERVDDPAKDPPDRK